MKSIDWHNRLSNQILRAALEVHKEMGPGLLESIYEDCLHREFILRGIRSENQVNVPLSYKDQKLDKYFRLDLLVESEIIVEIKSVIEILPVHEAQIISYLKLTNKRLGFLINFNVNLIKNGFYRYVNNF